MAIVLPPVPFAEEEPLAAHAEVTSTSTLSNILILESIAFLPATLTNFLAPASFFFFFLTKSTMGFSEIVSVAMAPSFSTVSAVANRMN